MEPVQILDFTTKRRRAATWPDFGAFFMFFGVSGIDEHREERGQKRFEHEYYDQLVSLRLSAPVPPGRYRLEGLPTGADRRVWVVRAGNVAQGELSAEGLQELKVWAAGRERRVQPQTAG